MGSGMGLIEQWGSGIDKMRGACIKAGIPEPKFEEHQGFRVIFKKDIFTEEYQQKLGLNERQIKAVIYVKQKGGMTNREYRKPAINPIYPSSLTGEREGVRGKQVSSPTLEKGGEGGFKNGKRQGNVAMIILLNSIKDPARLQWHEVYPERRLNAAERVKKVGHYYLSIDAVTQLMQVREKIIPYRDQEK